MKIEENSPLKIYPTKQTIDQPLSLPPPFDDRNQVVVVTGAMGTGKTTWLHSALTCRKKDGKIFSGCFERVIYATPLECFTSEENHPMKRHVKSRLFHVFDVKMLNEVVEQAKQNKLEHDGNTIFVLDDFSEELKNIETIKLLKKMIYKHRHLQLTIVISCLTLKSIPKTIRSLIDLYVIFKPKSLIEIDGYTEEIFSLNKNVMERLLDFVFDAPFNFLLYNARKHLFFKNFSRLEKPM